MATAPRETSATRALTLFTAADHVNTSLEGWERLPSGGVVAVNARDTGYFDASGVYRPGEILVHPPETSGFVIVRWTAPAAGNYALSAFWQDASWGGGDGCHVSVVRNGTQIVFGTDFDNAHGASTTQVVNMAQGDIIEFLVGPRGGYFADATRFDAIIKRVPDVSAVWDAGRDLAANEKPDGGAQETQNPNPTVPPGATALAARW